MWHTLEDIANSRLLDAEQFAIYVKENFPHYLDRFNMLHSMEIEPIVQDYRNSMTTEEVEAERQRIIQERMKERQPT